MSTKNQIKNKYKNFLDKNFFFSFDKDDVALSLSSLDSNKIDLIIRKSQPILDSLSFSSDKVKFINQLSNSSYDKIYAISACNGIIDALKFDSDKNDALTNMYYSTPTKIYALSLVSPSDIRAEYFSSDQMNIINDILYASTDAEAFSLAGYNYNPYDYCYYSSTTYPYYDIYYPYTTYYADYNYYPTYTTYPYYPSNVEYINQTPVVNNHYHYTDNKGTSDNDSSSLAGLGVAAAALAAVGTAAYLLLGDDNNSNNNSNNNSSSKYNDSYYDNNPPSYESIYPSLDGFGV